MKSIDPNRLSEDVPVNPPFCTAISVPPRSTRNLSCAFASPDDLIHSRLFAITMIVDEALVGVIVASMLVSAHEVEVLDFWVFMLNVWV